VIPPGGSGQLTARVKTKQGTTGKLAKSVVVQTDAPGAEQLRLVVSFNVVTPIVVSPSHRVYLNTVEGQTRTERVLLHRADGEPLQVTLEEPALGGGLEARVQPFEAGAAGSDSGPAGVAGDQWLEVTIGDGAQPMNHSGVIALATNQPELPRLEIPLIVRIRPLIDVRPSLVQLWLPDGGPDRTTALVRLSHVGRQQFEITAVEVADPSTITAQVVSGGPQQLHSLRVALADDVSLDVEVLRTSLRVLTSEAAKPELLVPVEVHARNRALRPTSASRPAGSAGLPQVAAGGH
jgi:hypothetical protein